jgi:type IV pilus assembly protein PilY1
MRENRFWPCGLIFTCCMLIIGPLFFRAVLAHADVDLADTPMFTKINPPPANIMILLDDSGSMTYEILVKGQNEGQFPNPDSGSGNYCYVFDDMGDEYNYTDSWRALGEEGRTYWKSQWHEVNAIYYNPNVTYEPWTGYGKTNFAPADKDEPLVHPLKSLTLDLDNTSFTVDGVDVKHAHYFVYSKIDARHYLVVMDGEAEQNIYYLFTVSGIGLSEKVDSLTEVFDPPSDIKKAYDFDRQNFANWFTYYRRREFTAKAAIARAIKNLAEVRLGILGINGKLVVPLKPVKATINDRSKDETDTIIENLLSYTSRGSTPLKRGLQTVGDYYQANDGRLEGQSGDKPFPVDGGACQQSFTIIVTDGYYSDTSHKPFGNTDGDDDPPFGNWGGGRHPYADNYGGTLADIAMYYYASDLSDIENKVPTNTWDKANHQHMVTFAVAFGVSGTLDPHEFDADLNDGNGNTIVWPNVPGDREPESIDDLWHATVNGRGQFLNAGHSQALVDALDKIMSNIGARRTGSGASVSINGDWLYAKSGSDILIFQTSYSNEQDEWFGDVKAHRIDPVSGKIVSDPVAWSAAETLAKTIEIQGSGRRKILTYNRDENAGTVFEFANLTKQQKEALGWVETDSDTYQEAKNRVDFIRGDDVDDLRPRSQKLGDIVHSSPVYEDDVMYVGANDGMLHAFDPNNRGHELFAYIPDLVFGNLKHLTDPAYTHTYYVDLTPTVQKGRGLLGGTQMKTILVGGLAKGGKGYFALDITDPHAMTPTHVLWEFPNASTASSDRDDMGYSFGNPIVVQSYDSNYPWIVIFSNGYNSKNGKSVLFMLDPIGGSIIKKIEAGSGTDNGLSSPIAIDVDSDNTVDFIYAGDLKGNLWKFDLSDSNSSEWDVAFRDSGGNAVPLFTAKSPSGTVQPITIKPDVMHHPEKHGYIVCFGTGKFLGDSDFSDYSIQTIYGIWDYGDRVFEPTKGWSADDNTEYLGEFVSRDLNSDTLQLSNQPPQVKLLKQEFSDFEVDLGGGQIISVRTLTANEPIWETRTDTDSPKPQLPDPSDETVNHVGWYLDLPAKERVISDVLIRDGILIAIGFSPSEDRCGPGGDSVFMELNAFTGGRLSGIQFDINDDNQIDDKDSVKIIEDGEEILIPPGGIKLAGNLQPPAIIRLNQKTEKKYLSSSEGGIVEITEKAARLGVAYWMEIR